MRHNRKAVLLFSISVVFGVWFITSCSTDDTPKPSISEDNIVGIWSTSIMVKKDDNSADVNYFGQMTYNSDLTGKMKFDGFDESDFDWKSNDSTVTLTNADGVQRYSRTVNTQEDQVMHREELVKEVINKTTVTMTRK